MNFVEEIFARINNIKEREDCENFSVSTDENMILIPNKDTFIHMVDTFDILGLDFTTGYPTEDNKNYYICFD
jgi:hypothetical protein